MAIVYRERLMRLFVAALLVALGGRLAGEGERQIDATLDGQQEGGGARIARPAYLSGDPFGPKLFLRKS